MGYAASILADSVSPEGHRLTTFEVTLPRIVLAEFNTHRMVSRNSASSRAIPISVTIRNVEIDGFIPETFLSAQKGMVAAGPIEDQELARCYWNGAREAAIDYVRGLDDLGVSKGQGNRLIEPFMWHTIIATATDWQNFFTLRTAADAQEEIRKPAQMMLDLYEAGTPEELGEGEYHIPLVTSEEFFESSDYGYWVPVSVGRCARVSYNRQHDGGDPDNDVARHNSLKVSRHLSPFEHAARPFSRDHWYLIADLQGELNTTRIDGVDAQIPVMYRGLEYAGNLHGWWSARMDVPGERGED